MSMSNDRKYGASSFHPAMAWFHLQRSRAAVAAAVEHHINAPGLSDILVQVSRKESVKAMRIAANGGGA